MNSDIINIVSFSGGKDSTAMLLKMIELEMKIDDVVCFSMDDWEWPQMEKHIEKVKKILIEKNIKFTLLKTDKNKIELLKKRGFPNMFLRWCTGMKTQRINQYLRSDYKNREIKTHIGIAADEKKRIKEGYFYPLADWGWTEKMALEYCYEKGFDWDGLYELLPGKRVSCWCCPLQKVGDLRVVWTEFPELWDKLRYMQSISYQAFHLGGKSVYHFEDRFWREKYYTKINEKKKDNDLYLFPEIKNNLEIEEK